MRLLKPYFAYLYDLLIILTLNFVATLILVGFRHGEAIAPATRWYQLLLLASYCCYFLLSWCNGGQTIGMKSWQLKLQSNEKPNGITLKQALSRFLLAIPAHTLALPLWTPPQKLLKKWTQTTLV